MNVRYYAGVLNDDTIEAPAFVFREVTNGDYRTDVWDRAAEQWKTLMSLIRYTKNGEPGAEEITKVQADRIIKGWRK